VVHVTSSRRSHRSEVKDGGLMASGVTVKVGPKYPLLTVISFLARINILVLCWTYK
jgi:hypothetical protein